MRILFDKSFDFSFTWLYYIIHEKYFFSGILYSLHIVLKIKKILWSFQGFVLFDKLFDFSFTWLYCIIREKYFISGILYSLQDNVLIIKKILWSFQGFVLFDKSFNFSFQEYCIVFRINSLLDERRHNKIMETNYL